ncbi:MAG: DUF5060 domain-containing protein [Candidatus Omnitrophica bacterium]|nr:DUF5060 domain-containing protein [Candidatus Omnitrophota bacterium]
MRKKLSLLALIWIISIKLRVLFFPKMALAANFTRGEETAQNFGVHEIVLTGNGSVTNPFDTQTTITFISPTNKTIPVNAFYDGGNTWRARVYINEIGSWKWQSSSTDSGLNNKSGSFIVVNSNLRGMLRKHKQNPRQLMTDNEQTFINIADTAYFFFSTNETDWQKYIKDDINYGISSIRSDALGGGLTWDMYWSDTSKTRFNLTNFQNMDARLQWLLNNYPNLQVQIKLVPGPSSYGADETVWQTLSQTTRTNLLRYLIARWSAYPNLFFEVTNDTRCTSSYPNTRAMAREIGNYFLNNDPWKHLLSFGPTRDMNFCFTSSADNWVSYITLETSYDLSADKIQTNSTLPLPIYNEEDYYETYNPPTNPRYFYRRLLWSWLLSGGSATYGGDWDALTPYSQTNLVGLDSIPFISSYFTDRHIDLALFQPADELVQQINAPTPEGNNGPSRPQAARRGNEEFIVYIPNAANGEVSGFTDGTISSAETSRRQAILDNTKTPTVEVNLSNITGMFRVEWYRAYDGFSQKGSSVAGGDYRKFTSPWQGYDVVLRLVSTTSSPSSTPTPTPTPISTIVRCDESCTSANSICEEGLICYLTNSLPGSEKCRHPQCVEENDCQCKKCLPSETKEKCLIRYYGVFTSSVDLDLNKDRKINSLDFIKYALKL